MPLVRLAHCFSFHRDVCILAFISFMVEGSTVYVLICRMAKVLVRVLNKFGKSAFVDPLVSGNKFVLLCTIRQYACRVLSS